MHILQKLESIDRDFVNIKENEIIHKLDELLNIAKEKKNEKWICFLESEKAYYSYNYKKSLEKNLRACQLDTESNLNNGSEKIYYFYSSLGVLFHQNNEFKQALDNYNIALKLNSKYYQCYLNRALLYKTIGKFNEASKDVEYVIENTSVEDNAYMIAIKLKGRLLIIKRRYVAANEILKGIYEENKTDAEYLDTYALSFVYLRKYTEAEQYYKMALKYSEHKGLTQLIKRKLNMLKNVKLGSSAREDILLKSFSEESPVISKIYSYLNNQEVIKQRYQDLYKRNKVKRDNWYNENYIICLKGWSSSTPEYSLGIMEENIKCGGGFFIHSDGLGIVIDPGIDFIKNLHAQGLFIQDIDYVIVTHNHIDHNNDLDKLIDMSIQSEKEICFLLDVSTYEKYKNELREIEKTKSSLIKKLYPTGKETILKIGDSIVMEICETEHLCDGSFGCKFEMSDKSIGYTSDTKYTDAIGEFFSECDVMIANISETNIDDLLLRRRKKNHLGIYGVYSLIRKNKKNNITCILAEFWGGLGDIRIETAEVLRKYLIDLEVDLLPSDIGLTLFLDNRTYLCSSCKQTVTFKDRRIVKCGNVNKSLVCLCKECIF